MPLNPNSREMVLMKTLHINTNRAEVECTKAIRNTLILILISLPIMIATVLLTKIWWFLIPLGIYAIWNIILIFWIIPYHLNLGELRDAINGDRFQTLEVNLEMVNLWINNANICIGRAQMIRKIYPFMVGLYMFLFVFLHRRKSHVKCF